MNIKSMLLKRRSGASTFEWVLTLPFMITILFIVFYIMLVLFSWASYGAVASNMAKDLNIRSSGLIQANEKVGGTNVIMQGKTAYNKSYVITRDQVTVNGKQSGDALLNSYKNAVIYHMTEYANQFYFPYTEFDSMNVNILQMNEDGSYSKTFDVESTLSNYIIKVDIKYKFAPVRAMGLFQVPPINLTATGYGVVT